MSDSKLLISTLLGDTNAAASTNEVSSVASPLPLLHGAPNTRQEALAEPSVMPATPDPVDAIKLITDPMKRARAALDLSAASGGGVSFDDGVIISTNGKLWQSLVDQILSDRGEIMRCLPNSFVSSSPKDKIIGEVLDTPPMQFAEPDPDSDNRMTCRKGMTQRDAIAWATDDTTGALAYWGSDRLVVRDELSRKLADELDKPAVAMGTKGFSYLWVRHTNGRLLTIHRAEH